MDPSPPCTPSTCDISESPYGFRPALVASAVFATVSAACLVVNGAVAARSAHRHTATAPFCVVATLACVLELLGWVGRMAGWSDPWAVYPLMQSRALLTIAPVFITSSIYVCLAPMVRILGTEHSLVRPELYTAFLLPLDALALLLQVAGLAVGFRNVPYTLGPGDAYAPDDAGAKIVLTGLAVQLSTLVAAGLLLASVLLRAARSHRRYGYTTFHRDVGYVPLTRRFRIFAAAVPSAMVVLFGRMCFRVAEHAEGFRGPLATGGGGGGEGLFVGLEGFLVAYALAVVVGCHPALFLRDGKMVSRIEAEPFVGIDGVGGAVRGAEHERDLEELSKVYQRHHEEEEQLSRFERV
ncbi:sphingoid long-chain base transporter RSB1 [Colletotrichum tabaci]|uniref:Sphingoid long-chain base transporter RSB1 n=1 Tax=Colletotrichum tabaci TaxID=1209068 RepID=A0AAV9TXA1_9PEZI